MPKYNRGKKRTRNPSYEGIRNAIARAKRRGDRQAVHKLRKQLRTQPSQNPHDPQFRRLRYARYADDWLLGFSGPKAEAEEIKRAIKDFLCETLKLELSEEKTLITHARTEAAKFLGYQIVIQHADDKLDRRGQRQVNETIGLRVPKEVIEQKCALYMRGGKPAQRADQFYMTNRSELLQRVLADMCELCGSREQVEVHHIRKLADLEKPGKKEKPAWMKQMAARRRKTLVVCRRCHEAIHAGRVTKPIRKQGPESCVT